MNTESNPMYNSRRIADLSSSPNLEDLSDLLDASGRSRILITKKTIVNFPLLPLMRFLCFSF